MATGEARYLRWAVELTAGSIPGIHVQSEDALKHAARDDIACRQCQKQVGVNFLVEPVVYNMRAWLN